jgi:hypothetical protein
MNWDQAIETISPHVVKIETPSGWGSGFLTLYNHDKSWCGIATAAHVVSHADEWQQPIRIKHEGSATPLFLKSEERVIFLDRATDSAIVLLFKRELKLPESPIALLPMEQPCPIGSDIGWLGFPAIEPDTLCFFAGTISARQANRKAYLIDGVAINGVSGGPVFHCPTPDSIQIIGCVSAYHANRATGETLPGLLRAQDVSHFHGIATLIHNIDDAQAKKQEVEAAQAVETKNAEETANAEPADAAIPPHQDATAPPSQDSILPGHP